MPLCCAAAASLPPLDLVAVLVIGRRPTVGLVVPVHPGSPRPRKPVDGWPGSAFSHPDGCHSDHHSSPNDSEDNECEHYRPRGAAALEWVCTSDQDGVNRLPADGGLSV